MPLEIGSEAPDFTLVDSNGDEVTLSQFRGQPVYLNFFPAAFSPVCADWFSGISDDGTPYEGAVVIGVSVDGRWTLGAFKEHMKANEVHFLADFQPRGHVATLYDTFLEQAGVSGRCSYVIDANGVIVDVDQVAPLETPDAGRLVAALGACKA